MWEAERQAPRSNREEGDSMNRDSADGNGAQRNTLPAPYIREGRGGQQSAERVDTAEVDQEWSAERKRHLPNLTKRQDVVTRKQRAAGGD